MINGGAAVDWTFNQSTVSGRPRSVVQDGWWTLQRCPHHTNTPKRSGVIEACFHSVSVRGSDPSPILSASVINPTNTNAHLWIMMHMLTSARQQQKSFTFKLVENVPVCLLILTLDHVKKSPRTHDYNSLVMGCVTVCVCVRGLYPPQLSETSQGFLQFVCVMNQFRQEGWLLMVGSRSSCWWGDEQIV